MATDLDTENLNTDGEPLARFVVVCDVPSQKVWQEGKVMGSRAMQVFWDTAKSHGFKRDEFFFVTCAPPIPEADAVSEGRINKFVGNYREELIEVLKQLQNFDCIIFLGKSAGRQVLGRPCQITKIRGTFDKSDEFEADLFPMLSPTNVLSRPEVRDIFNSDFGLLAQYKASGYDTANMVRADDVADFGWCLDLDFLVKNPPKVVAVDTETDGLRWMEGDKILVVSLCWSEERAVTVPLDCDYYPDLTPKLRDKLIGQLKQILENPKVAVVGHNFSFDYKFLKADLGIEVANWYADSMQLAFAADENMLSKNLSDCVKRWIPEMASYSDSFEAETDYSRMRDVEHGKMCAYASGDALATFLLTRKLIKIVQEDERNWDCFELVQMPALRTFARMTEGMRIDTKQLADLERTLEVMEKELYDKLIQQVPGVIKRRHQEKGLKFSRDEFVRDILFSEDGFGFTPRVFTDTTKNLPVSERIPSVSSKEHLPYFTFEPFVVDLIQYQKLQKMRSTYVGKASTKEIRPLKPLKNGGLPRKVMNALDKMGLVYLQDGRLMDSNANVVRSRVRLLKLGEEEVEVKYRITVSESTSYLITSDRRILEESVTPATGFWQYLRNGNYIHPSFLLHATVTGRSSSRNPNAQNYPKRGAIAKEFRKIFIPSDGYVLIEGDLSQAEIRIAAWMAKEQTMFRIYREGGDIHAFTAAATLNISVDKFMAMKGSTKELPSKLRDTLPPDIAKSCKTYGDFFTYKRFLAKAVVFGFLYGMGWRKFQVYAKTDYGIDLTEEEAQHFRNTFFRLYPGLERWHKATRAFVREHGFVRSLHGALRRLPNIYSDDEVIQGEAERQAVNSGVQRFASDLGLIAMAQFAEHCPWEDMRPIAFIHDAVIIEAKKSKEKEAASALKWFLQNQPLEEWFGIKPPIPLVADCGVGATLSEIKEVDYEAKRPEWF